MNNLVYGFHSVSPLVWQSPETIQIIYLDGKRQDKRTQDLLDAANDKNVAIELLAFFIKIITFNCDIFKIGIKRQIKSTG